MRFLNCTQNWFTTTLTLTTLRATIYRAVFETTTRSLTQRTEALCKL